MSASRLSTLKAFILIAIPEICFGAGVECEAKQVSLCCHAGCVSMLIRSCFTNDGEKIACISRKAKGFIWHSLPGKQCPCASGWAASQLGLNCLQGRRHNITIHIRKHCNLLFACNFIWQKQGSWGKKQQKVCLAVGYSFGLSSRECSAWFKANYQRADKDRNNKNTGLRRLFIRMRQRRAQHGRV